MLLIVLFLSHCRQVRTSNQDVSRSISKYHVAAESYIFEDAEYILYRYRVSWNEARVICTSRKAHLVTFDTEMQMEFIVKSLGDSQYGEFHDLRATCLARCWYNYNIAQVSAFPVNLRSIVFRFLGQAAPESFWVGAQTDSSGSWYWIYDRQKLSSHVSNIQINDAIAENERQCLRLDLKNQDDPNFVPSRCTAHNAFVCQRHHESFGRKFRLIATVQIEEREFRLYSARATWPEAVLYCRHEGLQIAEVITLDEAESLALLMLRTRPVAVESAWIGGYSENGIWKWLPSADLISANAYLWRKNESQKQEGCLLLDRHICRLPVYLESRCDRKRDFLCQKLQNRTDSNAIDVDKSFEDSHHSEENINCTGGDLCSHTSVISVPRFDNGTNHNYTSTKNTGDRGNENRRIFQTTGTTQNKEEQEELGDEEDHYEYLDEYKFSTFFTSTSHTVNVDAQKKNESSSDMTKNVVKEKRIKEKEIMEVSAERKSEKPSMIIRLLTVRPYYAFEGPMNVDIASKRHADEHVRKWQGIESSNKQSPGKFREATVINDITVEIIKVNCRVSSRRIAKKKRHSP